MKTSTRGFMSSFGSGQPKLSLILFPTVQGGVVIFPPVQSAVVTTTPATLEPFGSSLGEQSSEVLVTKEIQRC